MLELGKGADEDGVRVSEDGYYGAPGVTEGIYCEELPP